MTLPCKTYCIRQQDIDTQSLNAFEYNLNVKLTTTHTVTIICSFGDQAIV